jgi:hypothetical protein
VRCIGARSAAQIRRGIRTLNRRSKLTSEIDPRKRLSNVSLESVFGGAEPGPPIPPPLPETPHNDCRIMYIMENIRERRFRPFGGPDARRVPSVERPGFQGDSTELPGAFAGGFPGPPDAEFSCSGTRACRRFCAAFSRAESHAESGARSALLRRPRCVGRAQFPTAKSMPRTAIFAAGFGSDFRPLFASNFAAGFGLKNALRRAPSQTSRTMPS